MYNRIQLLTNAGHVNARRNTFTYTTTRHPTSTRIDEDVAGAPDSEMQHIRSRLGRAVTTQARHTHTAQATTH
jgi:hypothetical protein